MVSRAALIANPWAGRGGCSRRVADVERALRLGGLAVDVHLTERSRHAVALTATALASGARLLVALGGDGTLNEVVAGAFAAGCPPEDLVIAPVPCGTGNSFVRDFGLTPDRWRESVERLLVGQRRPIDVARLRYRSARGDETAYCVNVFGVGFMAAVAAATNQRFKALGELGYSVAVFWRLAQLAAEPTRLELWTPDGRVVRDEPLTLAAACNSQWTGNRMWIAPQADPADGWLDVLTLGPISRVELLRLFPRLFRGTHLSHPAVVSYRASRLTLAPATASPLLVDGEVFGQTPVEIEVLPRALCLAV